MPQSRLFSAAARYGLAAGKGNGRKYPEEISRQKGGVQSSRAEAMESSLSNRLKADSCFEVKLVVFSHSKAAKRLRFSSGYFPPLVLAAGG